MSQFAKYYANDEYKQKHLAHMKERVPCKLCGQLVQRCNMTHHNKTSKKHDTILVLDKLKFSAEQLLQLQQLIEAQV